MGDWEKRAYVVAQQLELMHSRHCNFREVPAEASICQRSRNARELPATTGFASSPPCPQREGGVTASSRPQVSLMYLIWWAYVAGT